MNQFITQISSLLQLIFKVINSFLYSKLQIHSYKMSKKTSQSNKKDTISQQNRLKQQLKAMKKMDLSALKDSIHHLRQQLKHLINQKILIEKQIQRKNEQFMNDTYDLQKITKTQEEDLIQLQNKLQILKNTFTQAKAKKKLEFTQQITDLANRRNVQISQLKQFYQQLLTKCNYLKAFPERQIQYKFTLSKLCQRRDYITESHTKDINKMKAAFQNQRSQIQFTTDNQIASIQQLEVQKLREKLSLQQQIKKQNELMQQEIQLCEQERLIVENECQLFQKDIKLSAQQNAKSILDTQATQTYERSLRVLKLEGKMNKLKQFHAQEIKRLEQEFFAVDTQFQQEQRLISQKIQKLVTAMELKQRDYKKVKACSQMVLNQRSSLQAYLLQVFYQNPSLNPKNPEAVNEILRKLFIKINSKKTPISYKNYMRFLPTDKEENSIEPLDEPID